MAVLFASSLEELDALTEGPAHLNKTVGDAFVSLAFTKLAEQRGLVWLNARLAALWKPGMNATDLVRAFLKELEESE